MNKFKLILTICLVAVLTLTMGVATFANETISPMKSEYKFDFTDFLTSSNDARQKIIENPYLLNCLIGSTGIDINEEITSGLVEDIFVQLTSQNQWMIYWIVDGNQWIYNLSSGAGYDIEFFIDETTYQYIVNEFSNYSVETYIENLYVGILGVFSAIPIWIVGAVNTATGIFWANGTLTMLGILAIIAVAFGICLLVVSLITRFMGFRG